MNVLHYRDVCTIASIHGSTGIDNSDVGIVNINVNVLHYRDACAIASIHGSTGIDNSTQVKPSHINNMNNLTAYPLY